MSTHLSKTRQLERALGDAMRARLPSGFTELVMFCLKMIWAGLFGGMLLAGMILSNRIWQTDWPLARYDALLIYAIALQILFLTLRMESWREAQVILLFHATGTVMEIFKVNAGSWAYPGDGVIKLWDVPLYSGFMYASVGAFMARAIRLFDMRFAPYPHFWMTMMLACAIYTNFFAHHVLPDIRMALFAATILLFWRTRIWYRIGANWHWMPLPLAAFLSSIFLWLAENIGTATKVWLDHGQSAGDWVSLAKMGSWYLLLYVSFTTVTVVFRDALMRESWSPKSAPASAETRSPKPSTQSG
ncbi:MAG: DUF817 domain-containing protein [Shimia sp.]|uniref:DUF817 domain-containing protein n=1 Tax=Shimia sp. TaxID=1954381 RepID=UPI0040588B37